MSSASPLLTRNFRELESVVAYHVKEDKVAQGNYETCHIGCLARGKEDPDFIETEYGIPEIITRIQEAIFESLKPDEAVKFFASFPSAVACDGKDLTRIGWQFLASELRNLPEVESDIQAVIDPVIRGLDLLAAGKPWPEAISAARAIRPAADAVACAVACSAACAAACAACAAADAARAAGIAATRFYSPYPDYAADYAADATHHVADAAFLAAPYTAADASACAADAAFADNASACAADAAFADNASACASACANPTARAATRLRQRDTLLKLISEAPVRGN